MVFTIGIGLTTNVFASTAGTQVSPSTINLSAEGVTEVGIHTQLANNECDVSNVEVINSGIPRNPPNPEGIYTFDSGDLSFGVDSVGHIVITIIANSWEIIKSDLVTEETTFTVIAECGKDTIEVSDTANIVDNSGVKK